MSRCMHLCVCMCVATSYQVSSDCLIHYLFLPSLRAIITPLLLLLYYSSQWSRFNFYGHKQAAWLQLLFLIKGIGSGIIWSCPVNNRIRMAKLRCVGLHEIQYLRQFGSTLCPWPCSSIQNAICLQSGMTLLLTARQCQHSAHSPW